MRLRDAIDRYIGWRQAHGTKFRSGAEVLHLFSKHLDGEIGCDAVTHAQVRTFLAGNGPLTRYRAIKYGVLAGFYRHAVSRGYASRSPMPSRDNEPKARASAPPYVFSRAELHRLFGAIDVCRKRATQLQAHTFRTFLLLLYGAGLRCAEALHLTLPDVDLAGSVLTVRNSKFYRSRLVALAPQLADALRTYAARRARFPVPERKDLSFLANRDGTPLAQGTVRTAFAGLLRAAEIHGAGDTRQSPCLHSFRHTFAVHRLTAWYRQGADVQRLLPVLSTYLGHAHLDGTQVYLSMTPELLLQASLRFERYATGGNDA